MPPEMKPLKLLLRGALIVFALSAGFFFIPAGRSQPSPQTAENRFLFIFDTSADMKKRLPAVQAEVNELLANSLGGQLRAGDSLGVWTFDQSLRSGQFPLQHWMPDDAVTIASAINAFVGKQPYANGTSFNALQPRLNEVIENSGRLTVLIFCDGEDEIKWTPYDTGINQVFQQRLAEQKKTKQPFVLVLRMQSGKYAGCTLNFPPGMVSLPDFPPPLTPPAPPAPPAPTPAPVIKPPTVGAPLVINGTKVGTNWPPAPPPPPPANPAPMTPTNVIPAAPTNPVAPPPPANRVPAIQTNAVPAPSAGLFAPTNSAPVTPPEFGSVPPLGSMVSTNPAASSPENSGLARESALAIGGALLIAAGGLAALAVFRGRRPDRGSLITRSMRKN